MSYTNKLAKEIKKRDNKTPIGPQVGTILSVSPFKVRFLEGSGIIYEEMIAGVCDGLLPRTYKAGIEGIGDKMITLKDVIAVGDTVLCVPTTDEQKWYLIDKVVM